MIEGLHVGFTGTKQGASSEQAVRLYYLLKEFDPEWLHHGDCVGADEKAHEVANHLGIHIHVHPPTVDKFRANVLLKSGDKFDGPRPYLARNHDIVDSCTILIATPAQDFETLRSGTWATVRYAREKTEGRPRIVIIKQDGQHYDY